ncbi:hypothetical protein [Rubrivivax gelatinosus]|uniref:hypothetical protein n=1 Tax=Rubrivivax gelatinosus TaxID=28068 RepID=UPI0019034770|nr:hypothetical protein [Rubrivivax gelatinosus]
MEHHGRAGRPAKASISMSVSRDASDARRAGLVEHRDQVLDRAFGLGLQRGVPDLRAGVPIDLTRDEDETGNQVHRGLRHADRCAVPPFNRVGFLPTR